MAQLLLMGYQKGSSVVNARLQEKVIKWHFKKNNYTEINEYLYETALQLESS
jgi:hypothetical protein